MNQHFTEKYNYLFDSIIYINILNDIVRQTNLFNSTKDTKNLTTMH